MNRGLAVVVLGVALSVSACSSSSGSQGKSWASPADMRGAVEGALVLTGCDGPGVDITGAQKVGCFVGEDQNQQAAFLTYHDERMAEQGAEHYVSTGWLVHNGGSWVVAATDQATLTKAVSALS